MCGSSALSQVRGNGQPGGHGRRRRAGARAHPQVTQFVGKASEHLILYEVRLLLNLREPVIPKGLQLPELHHVRLVHADPLRKLLRGECLKLALVV